MPISFVAKARAVYAVLAVRPVTFIPDPAKSPEVPVEVSLKYQTPVYAAIVLGALSGVLGGLTRDVLCQVPPVLLHRETSGTVSVLGAAELFET